MNQNRYAKLVWGLLFYTLPVIVFGAYVRVSVSGDGCGAHWPDCHGSFLPLDGSVKTLVEFSHRLSSGFYGLWALLALILGFAIFPKGHAVRKGILFTFVFTIFEALIGRYLVKNELVAQNDSIDRAIWMSIHLANTFFLLGSATLTALAAQGGRKLSIKGQGPVGWALGFGLAACILLGVSGAVTALGDTLFPVGAHIDAVNQALSPTAHFLVKLRLLHPLIAMSVGIYVVLLAGLITHLRPDAQVKKWAQMASAIFLAELAIGLLNLALKAPVAMQLIHLFVADLLWISLVMMTANALAEGVERGELNAHAPEEIHGPRPLRTVIGEYVSLTKPRVISLLLFTTLTATFTAAGGWPGWVIFLSVTIGGYMSAGAANAINMVIDRDIDGTMKRTSKRPTVTQNIRTGNALAFGFIMALLSFVVLWLGANLLTAMLSLAGLAFYVVVYTLLLKRRTWHNIVIGGAAGAFPPLVGWAAAANSLHPLAWILFGIVFLWTPVHFWALAILIKDDYAEAGVPMLPVVHGERATVLQIGFYAILTAAASVLPFLQPNVGMPYLAVAIFLNIILFARYIQLYRSPGRPTAVSLYKYSMLYLAVLFLVLAVNRSVLM